MPPSFVTVNGVQTYRPGAYTEPDYSALAGQNAAARGVLAIVGAWERCKPNVPTVCNTPGQLKALLPDSGAQLASLIFAPSKDSRTPAGARQVLVVRTDCAGTPVARASLAMPDAGAAASVTAYAADYGAYGNRITVAKSAGTTAGTHKITTVLDGTTTVHDNIGGLYGFKARYTGAYATTMTITVDPNADPRVTISYTKTLLDAAPVLTMMAFDGEITFTLVGGVSPAHPNETTFTIVGTSESGATSEVVEIPAGYAMPVTSVEHWTTVTSITPANLPGGATYTMAGNAFALNLATYPTIRKVVDRINAKSANGFSATINTTENPNTFSVADLDAQTPAADIIAAAAGPKHDIYSICKTVNRDSAVITMTRAAHADNPPDTLGTTNLAGGTDGGVPTATDWETALASLRTQRANHVWIDTDDASVAEKLHQHCVYMWGAGKDERAGYYGVAANTSKANILLAMAALNSEYVKLCAQEIQVYDPDGMAVWLAPKYQALLAASMRAGMTVGGSLTAHYPNVLDFRQDSSWTPDNDAESMLAGMLTFMTREGSLIKWERDLTTYQGDNPILSEMSAMDSVGESCKDLRTYLQTVIGSATIDVTAATIAGMGTARLQRQKDPNDLRMNRGWRNYTVEDLGDSFLVDVEIAPIETVNFIKIRPHITRMPASV